MKATTPTWTPPRTTPSTTRTAKPAVLATGPATATPAVDKPGRRAGGPKL